MHTVPELSQINEKRFQYVHQGEGAPFIYLHGIMCQMNKLCEDNLPDVGKSKANFKKRISTPKGAYKIPKEELKMWRKKTGIFEKKYTKKMGA